MKILEFLRMLLPPLTLNIGGGGGGSVPKQPDKTTQTVINIPPYARPYVESLLGRTEALTTGAEFEPYNPTDRFQPLDPLQQQAYDTAAGMGTSPELDQAGDMIGQAMQQSQLGSEHANMLMNTALGYGQQGQHWGQLGADFGQQGANFGSMGAQFGQQAADFGAMGLGLGQQGMAMGQQGIGIGQHGMGYGDAAYNIGQQYQQGMTDPSTVQDYMSPYMQNVVDAQKQEAIRDYQVNLPSLHSQATSTGGFGGSRHAILEAEAQRNLGENLSNIQAMGQQRAYEDAMRNMQSGAQMGMQGAGMGMQGAGMGLQGLDSGMRGLQTGFQGIDSSMQGAGMGMQGAEVGIRGSQAGMQGAGMGLQGVETGLQGVGQGINAAQLGQHNISNLMQGAGLMGQLGQQRFGQQMGIIDSQQALGGMMQDYGQQMRDFDYQQYLDELNFPYQQLAFMSDMTQGLPLSQSTIYQNTPQQQFGLPQLMGLGMQAYGLANRAQGGLIEKPTLKYAQGGKVEPQPAEPMAFDGMHPEEIMEAISLMSDEQLIQYMQVVQDQTTLELIQAELGRRERTREQAEIDPSLGAEGVVPTGGLGAVPQTGLRMPAQQEQQVPPPAMPEMRGGGLVALAEGGRVARGRHGPWTLPLGTYEMHGAEPQPFIGYRKPHSRGGQKTPGWTPKEYEAPARSEEEEAERAKKREELAKGVSNLGRLGAAAGDVISLPITAGAKILKKGLGYFDAVADTDTADAIPDWSPTPLYDYLYRGAEGEPSAEGVEDKAVDTAYADATYPEEAPYIPSATEEDMRAPTVDPVTQAMINASHSVEEEPAPETGYALLDTVPQRDDSVASPKSYQEYMVELEESVDQKLDEHLLMEAMRSGLDDRRAQLEAREKRGEMDALIAAGAAMMRGRNLTEGLIYASEAGYGALMEATENRDALEDALNEAQLQQLQYELALERDDRALAQESYRHWMDYNQRAEQIALNYKVSMAKVGATLQAAQMRANAAAGGGGMDVSKMVRVLNDVDKLAENSPAGRALAEYQENPKTLMDRDSEEYLGLVRDFEDTRRHYLESLGLPYMGSPVSIIGIHDPIEE